jgi:aspartyl-tRNA(Asn)/glutamyl-tRNA(Gln) amidotransferase subunit A
MPVENPGMSPPSLTPPRGLPPMASLRQSLLQRGPGAHAALLDAVLAGASAPAAQDVFSCLWPDSARRAAFAADAAVAKGHPLPPLAGLPVSVKAIFDVAGAVTHAGSATRRDLPPATADAPAVARLRAAGAALVGHTATSEFAFTGVGLNPHFGTPRNPWDAAVARIPGGSSAGAAVSVALGLAVAGLGSDTAGSIRVPAALCGLVGFKPTQRRVPLAGVVPLSTTLDTACAMARTVADCLAVDAVIADTALTVAPRPLSGVRLALPGTLMLDGLEPQVAAAFEAALAELQAAGAEVVALPLALLAEIAQIQQPGFSPVEAWAWHRDQQFDVRRDAYDPCVAARIALGEGVSAVDYLRMHARRRDWILRMQRELADVDAIVCPTVPLLAPPMAPLQTDRDAFFRINGALLRNTLVANFMDGCAVTLPCQPAGVLPVGLMLTAPAGQDAALMAVALAIEAALQVAGLGTPHGRACEVA